MSAEALTFILLSATLLIVTYLNRKEEKKLRATIRELATRAELAEAQLATVRKWEDAELDDRE